MNRFFWLALAIVTISLCGSWGSVASAQVQFSAAPSSPTVSPYLNLVFNQRPNTPTYQTLVRPLVQGRQDLLQQQSQISSLQGQANSLQGQISQKTQQTGGASTGIRGTGHQTAMMNYLHYYPQRTGGGPR